MISNKRPPKIRWLPTWALIALISFLITGCASLQPCSEDPACIRVLFIGNSYTFVNDLPTTLTSLAQSGGQRVETGMVAEGGWTLSQHAASSRTLDEISNSKWNYVVLQEQSQIPASNDARQKGMYPAARVLAGKIRAAGATPVLFVTWGHQIGWPEAGLSGYLNMQAGLDEGYRLLAAELQVPQAPVGYAWQAMFYQFPDINLWQEDGSHPNEKGTYLAACVFYTVLFRKSPEGLSFVGNLSKEEAAAIQKVAGKMVLDQPRQWGLP